MKKLFISLLLLTVFFLTLKKFVFAQNSTLFEATPIYVQQLTNYQTQDQQNPIDAVTSITVPKGSFSVPVSIYVYKGIQNQLTSMVPPGQTPISSYKIIFLDTNGKQLTPTNATRITITNNYQNTPLYYYPLVNAGIDQGMKSQINASRTIFQLPVNDEAFTVAVNASSIPSAQNLTQIPTPTAVLLPTSTQTQTPSITKAVTPTPVSMVKSTDTNQTLKTILLAIIVICVVLFAVTALIYRRSKIT